jgi:hypothetical protein
MLHGLLIICTFASLIAGNNYGYDAEGFRVYFLEPPSVFFSIIIYYLLAAKCRDITSFAFYTVLYIVTTFVSTGVSFISIALLMIPFFCLVHLTVKRKLNLGLNKQPILYRIAEGYEESHANAKNGVAEFFGINKTIAAYKPWINKEVGECEEALDKVINKITKAVGRYWGQDEYREKLLPKITNIEYITFNRIDMHRTQQTFVLIILGVEIAQIIHNLPELYKTVLKTVISLLEKEEPCKDIDDHIKFFSEYVSK